MRRNRNLNAWSRFGLVYGEVVPLLIRFYFSSASVVVKLLRSSQRLFSI